MLGLVGLALLKPPSASGANLDCASPWLNRTEQTVCGDPQLLRLEEQLARRLDGFAPRLKFGQYLGLRHWHAVQTRQRSLCVADRDCIVASFRAQGRFLDRLQRCVAAHPARRACLRETLAREQESTRN